MNTNPRDSSLERFLQGRGLAMLGHTYTKRTAAIQIGVGWTLCGLGSFFLFAPLLGAPVEIMSGIPGPLAGGLVNLSVGYSIRKKLRNEKPETVNLTPEAKAILTSLVSQFGISLRPALGDFGGQGSIRRRIRERHAAARFELSQRRMPPVIASSTVIDALDLAASQYNRIAAVLSSTVAGSTLAKMAPRIASAADEAIAEALHQAAIWSAYPEGSTATASRLVATTEALRELAERTETLASQEPSLSERLAYRSGIDEVLEELRLDQLARSELHSRPDAPQDHRA